jgi:2-polyprenyl-3-methyl-5-hydroxy-6-metoxy-1,4-benzoquinol methylase
VSKEHAYWDSWYRSGGSSGEGSVGAARQWKWSIILKHSTPNSVIDYGCGDLSFWEGKDCQDYLGIDISENIIVRNQAKRPNWRFITIDRVEEIRQKKPMVFCLDVLFHVMSDALFDKTLEYLCKLSSQYIFIYTWLHNPFSRQNSLRTFQREIIHKPRSLKHTLHRSAFLGRSILFNPVSDGKCQTYRDFKNHVPYIEEHGFDLIELARYNDGVGAMWVFHTR